MTLRTFLFLKEVRAGVYFFAASVLASMAVSLLMNRLAHHEAEASSV